MSIVDPTFLRQSNYSYVDYNDTELASVLCFALSKHNADLILHQQRIELYAKTKQANLLFSALVDLFTALGTKGQEYKQRVLDTYGSLLTTNQTTILIKAVVSELSPVTNIRGLQQSILNLGVQGNILSARHMHAIK